MKQFIIEIFASSLFFALLEFLVHRYSHVFNEPNHIRHHRGLSDQRKYPALGLLLIVSLLAFTSHNLHIEGLLIGLLYRVALFTILHELYHSRVTLPKWLDRLRARHLLHHQNPAVNFGTSMRYLDRIVGTEREGLYH